MIVEDEVNILKYMKKRLSKFECFIVEGAISEPEEAIEQFDNIKPDVIFLDIEMPRINGIDLAKKLLEKKADIMIVFTTAYSQYALDAFGVEAIDYLLKPIGEEDILRVIKRLDKAVSFKKSNTENANSVDEVKNTTFSVRCFGQFQLLDNELHIVKWPTRKSEELFAYFVTYKGQYISKWKLLELFWSDMDEERGLHNLYNTVYRIKQVIKKVQNSINIKKVNDGYILETQTILSDLDRLNVLIESEDKREHMEEMIEVFFLYTTPLFGTRDYFWSIPVQENASKNYKKMCKEILHYYREKNEYMKAQEVIGHYVLQHIEDEDMMISWIEMLKEWPAHKEEITNYKAWFNKKLHEADLPEIL